MASGQTIEQYIECPRSPEIFFDVLFGCAESRCSPEEDVAAVPWCCSEKLRKTGIHHDRRLAERSSPLRIASLVIRGKLLRAVLFEWSVS